MNLDLIKKYNVINKEIDVLNPLSVGNGSFVFTADVTGLQTLVNEYKVFPLLSMEEKFAYKEAKKEIKLKSYQAYNRNVNYMTDSTNQEEVFNDLRTNYFKYNMFNLAFYYNDKLINKDDISNIDQELDLIHGTLYSNFKYNNQNIQVITRVCHDKDKLIIEVKSKLLNTGLIVKFRSFKADYNKYGCLNELVNKLEINNNLIKIEDDYRKDIIKYETNGLVIVKDKEIGFSNNDYLQLSLDINNNENNLCSLEEYFLKLNNYLSNNEEINRRIILSLYLIRINSCAKFPPAETGLTCNSWYGKFHLEMHLWHHLGLIYYGAYEEVINSLDYYFSIYEEAKKRAKTNGFNGCRWPKMTDPSGLDSPSSIGPLLMWQQPHLVFMLLEIKRLNQDFNLSKYDILIKETLACLTSFFYKKDDTYYLDYPLIPACECYDPLTTFSPIFEVEYFCYVLDLANSYGYGTAVSRDIVNKAVKPKVIASCYEGHINTNETYIKFNKDHPLPIMAYSFFKSKRLDRNVVLNSLNKINETWNFNSLWGWDFPSLALAYYNLGYKDKAIKMLLADYSKNTYLKNGHNMQKPEEEILPLYLPGNGAFLIACYHLFKSH